MQATSSLRVRVSRKSQEAVEICSFELVSADGSPLRPPMGFSYYARISDADLAALIAYLRSLKPLKAEISD